MRQNPIENPANAFKLIIKEDSRKKLNDQVELHIKFINEFLESN
jgi:hypothetical protein